MKKIFLILSICLIGACGTDTDDSKSETPPPGFIEGVEVTVDEMNREYNLYVPQSLPEGPVPLLLAFHGGGGRGWAYPQQAQFQALADSEGLLIAYPQAELMPGNEGEWQLNTPDEGRHDIRYVEAIIDQVASRFNLEENRVYATGYSLGSMFTYELACHLSSRFAASSGDSPGSIKPFGKPT